MYVRNHITVPEFGWYFRMRIGCGTGRRPTKVPCWRNLMISLSSVRPRSMQIFSTWGTSTCRRRVMVCNGNLLFHDWIHSGVADQLFSSDLPARSVEFSGNRARVSLSWWGEAASVRSVILWIATRRRRNTVDQSIFESNNSQGVSARVVVNASSEASRSKNASFAPLDVVSVWNRADAFLADFVFEWPSVERLPRSWKIFRLRMTV